jgi:hypothetical protein
LSEEATFLHQMFTQQVRREPACLLLGVLLVLVLVPVVLFSALGRSGAGFAGDAAVGCRLRAVLTLHPAATPPSEAPPRPPHQPALLHFTPPISTPRLLPLAPFPSLLRFPTGPAPQLQARVHGARGHALRCGARHGAEPLL